MVAFASPTPLLRNVMGGRRNVRHGRMCSAMPESNEASGTTASKNVNLGPAPWVPIKKVKSNASWRYQYVDEFKKKGTGSALPYDLRPVSLRGSHICPMCDGTGEMICSWCNGLEYYYVGGKAVTCPSCGGKHTIECSSCGGTGIAVELEEGWWEKGIAGLREEVMKKLALK